MAKVPASTDGEPTGASKPDAEGAPLGQAGLFLVGGIIKEVITTPDAHVVREHLSSLLQVKNLVVLLGSGASFHLGSPRTRDLTNQQVIELVAKVGGAVSAEEEELLTTVNPRDNGDLEQLLSGLQLATSLASQAHLEDVTLGTGERIRAFPKPLVERLRHRINRALAESCHLPAADATLAPPFDRDPLLAHRNFLSGLVQSRRSSLLRPRVFTTNYDLVIENALDELGYPYIDGFSGTLTRRLNLAFYGLDFHRVDTTTLTVLARAEGALYLHKVHGSLNWRASVDRDRRTGLESLEVRQHAGEPPDDDLVVIYPTAAKEGDSLAYPYSDLLRLLGDAVQQEDTAVLVAGYGFADPHINRLLLRSLAGNPALNLLVADPKGVLTHQDMAMVAETSDAVGRSLSDLEITPKSTALAALATAADSRIAVLTGEAGKFTELASLMPSTASGGNVNPPAAISSLIAALGDVGPGQSEPLLGSDLG